MNQFIYNSKYHKEGTPVIGADNRGLRYGDGLFETIRYSGAQLQFVDEHFARLWKGLQILKFEIPRHFTPDKLQEEVMALLQKNGHNSMARVRITVCRGDGGLYDAVNRFPNYFIQSWELPEGNGAWNSNGLVTGIYDEVRKSADILSNLKHNNYLPYVMAALHAKEQKWNDAILLNNHGNICDTTIANIFLVKNGQLFTPPLGEGCVAGILRKHLLQHLPAMHIPVFEKQITPALLTEADEVFLTNSIYNIRWVQQIGDAMYGNTLTRKIYDAILPTIS